MYVSRIKFLKDDSCTPFVDSSITYSNDHVIMNKAEIGNMYDKHDVDDLLGDSLVQGAFRFSENDLASNTQVFPIVFFKKNYATNGADIIIPVTRDGTNTGIPVFSSLTQCIMNVVVQNDTISNNEAPWAFIKSLDESTAVVHLRVMRSNSSSLTDSSYQGNVDNDQPVTVHFTLIGPKNSQT